MNQRACAPESHYGLAATRTLLGTGLAILVFLVVRMSEARTAAANPISMTVEDISVNVRHAAMRTWSL